MKRISILSMSTLDIQREAIKTANQGYVPEDLLTGGLSTMFNIEKSSVHTHPLTITNEQKSSRPKPSISLRPSTYSERLHGDSILHDTPSVFVPGSMPKIPMSQARPHILALGKLRAYAEANSDNLETFDHLLSISGLSDRHLIAITPVTTSDRTKPWALDDLPRSRTMTGGYNLMQNVRVALGNYRSGVNTKGRSIDYQRVASALRSVAMQLFGYEAWSYRHFAHLEFSINYHLNLDEFPQMSTRPFMTKYLEYMVQRTFFPDSPSLSYSHIVFSEYLASIDLSRRHLHLVPISTLDPNIKLAQAELAREMKSSRVLAPYMALNSLRDISTPGETFRSFSLLETSDADSQARKPSNIFLRLLTPWLKKEGERDMWPHTVMTLTDDGLALEAAAIIKENLDPRLPRLAFDILKVLTPVGWDSWKQWFRWLFLSAEVIPVLHIKDPTHALYVSLKENPTVFLRVFMAAYRASRIRHSLFSIRDFLVPEDSDLPSTLDSLYTRLYKRIANAYVYRYRARAEQSMRKMTALTGRIGVMKKRFKDLREGEKLDYKEAVKSLAKYQWRIKMYPNLPPVSHTNTSFDPSIYLSALHQRTENYLRKRGKILELSAHQLYVDNQSLMPTDFEDHIQKCSTFTGLDFWEEYVDICQKRSETISDINQFLAYDTNLSLPETPDNSPTGEEPLFDGTSDDELEVESDDDAVEDDSVSDGATDDPNAPPRDILGFSTMNMGMAGLRTVQTVRVRDELEEKGYSHYWVARVAEEFGLEPDTVVHKSDIPQLLSWLEENYHLRFRNPGETIYETEADIT